MNSEFKKKKINIFTLLWLFLAIGISWYTVFGTNIDYNTTDAEIKRLQSEEKKNDAKMQENPMYKRLNAYGLGLSTIGNILKYKEASPTWYQFLQDFAHAIPKNITIRSLQYSPDKQRVVLNILASDRKRLIETMNLIEDFEGLKQVDFDGITEEKVTFKWEKVQYTGYGVNLTADVDPEYLKSKYETAESVKNEKMESESQSGQTSKEDAMGSGLTSTWSHTAVSDHGTGEPNVVWENSGTGIESTRKPK